MKTNNHRYVIGRQGKQMPKEKLIFREKSDDSIA